VLKSADAPSLSPLSQRCSQLWEVQHRVNWVALAPLHSLPWCHI